MKFWDTHQFLPKELCRKILFLTLISNIFIFAVTSIAQFFLYSDNYHTSIHEFHRLFTASLARQIDGDLYKQMISSGRINDNQELFLQSRSISKEIRDLGTSDLTILRIYTLHYASDHHTIQYGYNLFLPHADSHEPVLSEYDDAFLNDTYNENTDVSNIFSQNISNTSPDIYEFSKKSAIKETHFFMTPIQDAEGKNTAMLVMVASSDEKLNALRSVATYKALFFLPLYLLFSAVMYFIFIRMLSQGYLRIWEKLKDVHHVNEKSASNVTVSHANIEKAIVDLAKQEREKSYIDSLTRLQNRRYFEEVMLPRLHSDTQKIRAVVMIDLDDFKLVNDTQGHFEGDRVLVSVSKVLRQNTTEKDSIIRWGGEEILAILECDTQEEVVRRSNELLQKIAQASIPINPSRPAAPGNIQLATAGCVTLPFYVKSPALMDIKQHITLADVCLYYGKKNGKNQCVTAISHMIPTDLQDIEKLTTDMDYCVQNKYYYLHIDKPNIK